MNWYRTVISSNSKGVVRPGNPNDWLALRGLANIFAVMTEDGVVYYDFDADSHPEVALNFGLIDEDGVPIKQNIIDGGFIGEKGYHSQSETFGPTSEMPDEGNEEVVYQHVTNINQRQ